MAGHKVTTAQRPKVNGKRVCADCHRETYVAKADGWRASGARCWGCGGRRLLTHEEAASLGISPKK